MEQKQRWCNSATVISNIVTVAILAVLGLWFQGALSQKLSAYVELKQFEHRNAATDNRFDKLESDRIVFQKEVIERLTRIEALFAAHVAVTAPLIVKP